LLDYVRWESLYGSATSTNDVLVGGNVVLHGCAQPGSSVRVRTITVLPGATVRETKPEDQQLGRSAVVPVV
jgi:hypothetical protein